MTQHVCTRCGHEDTCEYGNWPDRHPVMAVIAGVFTLTLMAMMFSVYPVAALTMTALAAVWVGVRAASRERRRRAGVATRADWEHAAMMATAPPRFGPRPPVPVNPPPMAPRHVMNIWPTSRIPTARSPR